MLALAGDPRIAGFTNPIAIGSDGPVDYAAFAGGLLRRVREHPVSLDVLADEPEDVARQARIVASWGENVYVRIPIVTTKGESLAPVVRLLSEDGIKVNVTGVLTTAQIEPIAMAIKDGAPSYVSVLAGGIADAGVDPVPIVSRVVEVLRECSRAKVIWSSSRELLNLVQADRVGCHIIALSQDLINKLDLLGKDLEQYSLETVQMFYRDASAAGFEL